MACEEKRILTIDILECEKSSRRKEIIESCWFLNIVYEAKEVLFRKEKSFVVVEIAETFKTLLKLFSQNLTGF